MNIKLGQINFYCNDIWGDTGKYRFIKIIEKLNKFTNNHYEYCDCLKEECDIVIYALYNHLSNLKNVKGNPMLIYWTDELLAPGEDGIFNNPFEYYKNNNLSISFYDDSDDNLFYPYFALFIDELEISHNIHKINYNKNKFCTFCASNENIYNAAFRTNVVKYISANYKQITCCGKVLNNTNGEYLPYEFDAKINYHNNYKFNLCFENHESSGNLSYITEKIMNAFIFQTVPIYWGSKNILKWFNPNAFINCNELNETQILEKIKDIDNDDDQYQYMLNQYPFRERYIDLDEYFIKKLDNFIKQHIK